MKIEERINQAYNNEKKKHGILTIILFHIGDHYEAYYSDANTLAKICNLKIFTLSEKIPSIRFPERKVEEYMNQLVDANYSVCLSEVRGPSGQYILKSL